MWKNVSNAFFRQSNVNQNSRQFDRKNGFQLTFCDLALENTFQNRRVSSPAPVTMDSPSGLMAK